MENFFLTPTRGHNILDLGLSNNPLLIGKITTIISKHISDHNLMDMDINHHYTQPKDTKSKEKPYITNIHEYDVMKADDEDWLRWRTLLDEVDFENETKENKMKTFYETLEQIVAKVFKKKRDYSDKSDDDDDMKPKNKIPKDVRLLMRKIKEISNRILLSNT